MLLAHQGGWDELLLVLVPIVVVAWLLWLAKRRVSNAVPADPPPGVPASENTDQSTESRST